MPEPIVVIGGGQVAVQLCLALRKHKVDRPIVILSRESEAPYNRPPLSKSFLLDKTPEDKLPMRPESFYTSKDIDLQLDCEVTRIDPTANTVTTAAGNQLTYSHLVLACGAQPRRLNLPGSDLAGVMVLRDLPHSREIKDRLTSASHVVVIGAGFIGLEVAASATEMHKNVTLFDTADRVMARAVAPAISHWFEQMHRSSGVSIHLNEAISAIVGESGEVQAVERADGTQIPAQLIVMGIGVVPETQLAEQAGIDCDNGVLVDQFCRTSVANIYAAGDCANHPNPFFANRRIRLESIQNATDQARVIAANIAAAFNRDESGSVESIDQAYESVPWFWSDQGEHSLQMAGLSQPGCEYVLRGSPDSDSFSVFHYLKEQLIAVDSVNRPRDHIVARKFIGSGFSPDPEQVSDVEFDLKSLLN